MNTPDNEMWVDSTLDKFSKAHPFADIKAYNLFHAEAKAQIIAKLQEELESLLPNGKNLTTSAYGLWVQHELETRLLKAKAPQGKEDRGV